MLLAVLFSSFAFLANAQNIKNPQYTPPVLNTSRALGVNVFPTPSGIIQMNNAGFNNRLLVQEILEPFVNGTSENLTSLIVGGQRGLLIKDRPTIKGGLWLLGGGGSYADTDPRSGSTGAVGAGFYGDGMSRIATAPAASYVGFDNGNISFFAENNMIVGSGFKFPYAKMILAPTGRLTLAGDLFVGEPNTSFDGGLDIKYIDKLYDNTTIPNTGNGTAYFKLSRYGGMFAWERQGGSGPTGYVKMMRLDNIYGNTTGGSQLRVDGEVTAMKVRVTQDVWADYVFADDFKLRPLAEVATFIGKNKHLPDVPSEKEITANGLDLGEMQKIHMQKIEELTLYLLQQEKRIQLLEQKLLEISKNK